MRASACYGYLADGRDELVDNGWGILDDPKRRAEGRDVVEHIITPIISG